MYDYHNNDVIYEAIISSVKYHRRKMSTKESRLHTILAAGRITAHLRAILEEENIEKCKMMIGIWQIDNVEKTRLGPGGF